MANHEVVSHFNHSGRSSLLFQGSAEYRSRLTQADTLRLYHNYLTIEANRSKVARDPLQSQNSTIYKQILKSLCLYYILCHRPNHLKSITPTTRKDVTPLNRKPGGLMEQSNASLQRGDQG